MLLRLTQDGVAQDIFLRYTVLRRSAISLDSESTKRPLAKDRSRG